MIEPELLLKEILECDVEPECLIVDEQAVVISSEDRKLGGSAPEGRDRFTLAV